MSKRCEICERKLPWHGGYKFEYDDELFDLCGDCWDEYNEKFEYMEKKENERIHNKKLKKLKGILSQRRKSKEGLWLKRGLEWVK